ncbi:MAG: hypothetical protein ACLT76_18450 [Clostridium fessum]
MDRKETTKFLGELLERQYLSGLGKHWAKEVKHRSGLSTDASPSSVLAVAGSGQWSNCYFAC